jgi:hypothetical protein
MDTRAVGRVVRVVVVEEIADDVVAVMARGLEEDVIAIGEDHGDVVAVARAAPAFALFGRGLDAEAERLVARAHGCYLALHG